MVNGEDVYIVVFVQQFVIVFDFVFYYEGFVILFDDGGMYFDVVVIGGWVYEV